MPTRTLPIADIRCDTCEGRSALVVDAVERYIDELREGASFPPIVVYSDGKTYWLADGNHRLTAMGPDGLGKKTIEADVRAGNADDAIRYSLSANRAHGLPRTNRDKRHAAEVSLKHWPGESDRWHAETCAVGHSFVSKLRSELEQSGHLSTVDKTKTRDGKVRPRQVERSKPAAEPEIATATLAKEPASGPCEAPVTADVPATWEEFDAARLEPAPEMAHVYPAGLEPRPYIPSTPAAALSHKRNEEKAGRGPKPSQEDEDAAVIHGAADLLTDYANEIDHLIALWKRRNVPGREQASIALAALTAQARALCRQTVVTYDDLVPPAEKEAAAE